MASTKAAKPGIGRHQRPSYQEGLSGLTREDQLLVVLRNELYGQSWDEMEADLRSSRERGPHIFRLSDRIDEDLVRIARLRHYEERHGVDLTRLVADWPGEV